MFLAWLSLLGFVLLLYRLGINVPRLLYYKVSPPRVRKKLEYTE